MSRQKILILVVFLLFGSKALVAQKNIFTCSYPVLCTFGYNKEISEYSGIPNEIITLIAEDEIKNPCDIYFRLNTRMLIQILDPDGRNPMARISFGPQLLSGDIYFRKFSMAGVMKPNRVSFTCRVEKKDSSSIIDLPEVTDLNWLKHDSSLFQCQLPHFSCDSDTLVMQHLHFYFDEAALSQFKERVNLINDYYAGNAILDSLDEKVRETDAGVISYDPGSFFIMLEELNKILMIIKEKDFSRRLNLDSLDPEGFQVQYDRLSRFSLRATKTFRENTKTPGILNSSFSLDSLISKFLDGICRYIRWSMLVTERNSGIYHEFLDRYFYMNAFGDDSAVIRNLALQMFPAQNIDSSLAMISMKINKAYHERADELMKNQQYAETVELLENAHNFSEKNPWLKGNVNDRNIIIKAANGIYNSFLGVADVAIMNGKQEMAHTYMLRAQNYRREHATFITSDSLFTKVFGELVGETLSQCDTLFSLSNYPEAIECYNDFERGFDSLTLSLIHRVIESKIQLCMYKKLIMEGEKNLGKDDKPEAGRKFFLARELPQNEKFYPDSGLDSLCRITYPFYLIHLLDSGEVRIWTNQLDKARLLADSITFIQRTTGAESSRELSETLAEYRRKVEKRTCWNANETFEILLLHAQREIELKNFTLAALMADSAVLLIRQNPDCLIPSGGLKDTVDKYAQAVDFQNMQQNIDFLVKGGQYDKAISCYPAMEQFFSFENINRFGIECISMYEYIRGISRDKLTIQAILYFQGKNNLQEALKYLKLLRLQDYPKRKAKPVLEEIGKLYACKDFHDQPDIDPVLLVRSYIGKDDWMKKFRFAYYTQTQHLRHKPFFSYLFRKFFP